MIICLVWLILFQAAEVAAQPKGNPKAGLDLYVEKCMLCHGSQGEGWDWSKKVTRPPVPVPNLAKEVPGRSDQFLFDIIKAGGEAVGKTRFMPAFGFQASDQEIWDLVEYLRSLAEIPK